MIIKSVTVSYTLSNGDTMKKVIDESLIGKPLDIKPDELMTKCLQASTQIVEICKKEFSDPDPTLPFGEVDHTDQGIPSA